MDSISSNTPFDRYNPITSPLNHVSSSKKEILSSHSEHSQQLLKAPSKVQRVETYSTMFDDQELDRLQRNLESIAKLAEEALNRFDQESLN